MSIDDEEIDNLAELARLNLSDEERENLHEDLNEILNFAEKIQDVDTDGVDPTYHALPLQNVSRDDTSRESSDPSDVLDHAPDSSDGYFVVPKVIDSE